MNDRYLFKAKSIDDGEWVQGCYIYDAERSCSESLNKFAHRIQPLYAQAYAVPVDPDTICQCTGLKDKNGKLIWENDVVKCVDENNDIEFSAIIKFGNPNGLYSWGYQLQHIKGDDPNLDILLWVDMEETGATCEVIGNTFDNPELSESED